MIKMDEVVLRKILSYCKEIELSVYDMQYKDFMLVTNYEKRNSCSFALLQIGELTKKLDDNVKNQHSDIRWKSWSGIRNSIAHNYEGFDMKRAWNICKNHIPILRKSVNSILDGEQ